VYVCPLHFSEQVRKKDLFVCRQVENNALKKKQPPHVTLVHAVRLNCSEVLKFEAPKFNKML
jgi:hypothetical protein